ncbi:alkene reductase [Burkholderia stagnalis]|uniref:Alkene reductase n=1 Tax=Burkholderia stagnalis TaxID=1503054 RepID=A0A6L3N314_9BURK|nr:alkene reductase [Burkholderia stagnalis]KAB0640372.1 alkene reductase [Burkholderia stagnalis]KVO39489.1 alkene reductase [Burkholderia stagnalis]KVO74731.1 alkene reductase [Burkholderia stagnalis]KVW57675.1 alkene reductase [Burkholderia stagnalis]KVW71460.1 alkene reductase [Burkholderia stagnalis]
MPAKLFTPLVLGDLSLKNRIALPALTRSRSSQPGDVPNDLMVTYYRQRAAAGFMVTEGTQIEPRGQGYAWTPGIYSAEQIAGWRRVTDAVHEEHGIIFCQLWHVGRVSHVSLQPGHAAPVAPSAIQATAVRVFIETGPNEGALAAPSAPRELTTDEVWELVEMYRRAAVNAKLAGFDGVELHSANGYLLNQFISEHANHRTDEFGGSLDNRLRFLREVTQAVVGVFGKERVGVRFAPLFETTDEERVYLGLVEGDPQETYIKAAIMLNDLGVAYLSIAEADWDNSPDLPDSFRRALRRAFSGVIMYAGRYTREKALSVLENGYGDLFGFGRTFIANPDLPHRLRHGLPLNPVDQSTLYGGGERGYTDYPRSFG